MRSDDCAEIVFVCTGNRARSALGAALLQRRLGDSVRVSSRGTLALGSVSALPEMVRAAKAVGVDLADHTARAIADGELAGADLVLGFELDHVAAAVVDGGARREVVFTLPGFVQLAEAATPSSAETSTERVRELVASAHGRRSADDHLRPLAIEDPLGKKQVVFDRLAREIDELVDRLARALAS